MLSEGFQVIMKMDDKYKLYVYVYSLEQYLKETPGYYSPKRWGLMYLTF